MQHTFVGAEEESRIRKYPVSNLVYGKKAFEIRGPAYFSQFFHLPFMWPYTSQFIFLFLSFTWLRNWENGDNYLKELS